MAQFSAEPLTSASATGLLSATSNDERKQNLHIQQQKIDNQQMLFAKNYKQVPSQLVDKNIESSAIEYLRNNNLKNTKVSDLEPGLIQELDKQTSSIANKEIQQQQKSQLSTKNNRRLGRHESRYTSGKILLLT